MSIYKIEYSKESKQDLIEIKKYIKYNLQEPQTAIRLINRIKNKVDNLLNNPEKYSIIEDNFIEKLEIRKTIVGNYIIFYRIQKNNIQIVRVLYGKRNWIDLL